jgi:Cu(I)/Ag(I) efflux system membrane fusion protein
MSQRSLRTFLLVVTAALLLPAACTKKETPPVEAAAPEKPASAPAKDPDKAIELKTPGVKLLPAPQKTTPAFAKQLDGAVDSYLAMKDALVKSDAKSAAAMAARLAALLESADASGLEGEAGGTWQALATTMTTAAKGIAAATDIKVQRDHLFPLSEGMYAAAWSFEHGNKPLFAQFCPMAHTDKGGAHWLSDKSEIRNPYYGDAMLKCGEVKKVLR